MFTDITPIIVYRLLLASFWKS